LREVNAIIGFRLMEDYVFNKQPARQKIAERYIMELDGYKDLQIPVIGYNVWYKFLMVLPLGFSKEEFKNRMKEKGIGIPGGAFDMSLREHGIDLPEFAGEAEWIERHVCLPIYEKMTAKEVKYVIESVKEVLG